MGRKGHTGASLGGRVILSPAARRRQRKRQRWLAAQGVKLAQPVRVTKVAPGELEEWLDERFGGR